SIVVNGTTRTYLIAIPAPYDPNTPIPVYYQWHGSGGSGSSFRPAFGGQFESRTTAIFVYPDALPFNGGATPLDFSSASTRDTAFFDALDNLTRSTYCVDTTRIFSLGFSSGAYFTNLLGCVRASSIRAIAELEGGGPFVTCQGTVAAWMHHDDD